jgi:hypothetical protein
MLQTVVDVQSILNTFNVPTFALGVSCIYCIFTCLNEDLNRGQWLDRRETQTELAGRQNRNFFKRNPVVCPRSHFPGSKPLEAMIFSHTSAHSFQFLSIFVTFPVIPFEWVCSWDVSHAPFVLDVNRVAIHQTAPTCSILSKAGNDSMVLLSMIYAVWLGAMRHF